MSVLTAADEPEEHRTMAYGDDFAGDGLVRGIRSGAGEGLEGSVVVLEPPCQQG